MIGDKSVSKTRKKPASIPLFTREARIKRQLCEHIARRKPLWTIDDPANTSLCASGASALLGGRFPVGGFLVEWTSVRENTLRASQSGRPE